MGFWPSGHSWSHSHLRFCLSFSLKEQKLKKVTDALLSCSNQGMSRLGPQPCTQRQPRACWERPWTLRLSQLTQLRSEGRRSSIGQWRRVRMWSRHRPRQGRKGAPGQGWPRDELGGERPQRFPGGKRANLWPRRPGTRERGLAVRKAFPGMPGNIRRFSAKCWPLRRCSKESGASRFQRAGHWRGFSVTRHRFLMGGPERHTAPRAFFCGRADGSTRAFHRMAKCQ